MTRRTLLVLVAMVFLVGVIAGAVACQETPESGADSNVSDFLEVGETYRAWTSDDNYYGSFIVLQIISDDWVLARTGYGDGWFNISQLMYVQKD